MLGLSKIVDLSCGKVEGAASRNEDTMHAEMLRSWSRTYCTEMTMFSCTPLNQGLANPVINVLLLSYAAVQYIRFARAVLSIPEQVRMISISYMLWVRPQTQGRLTNLTAAITSNIAI
jgi:hypothetical protein